MCQIVYSVSKKLFIRYSNYLILGLSVFTYLTSTDKINTKCIHFKSSWLFEQSWAFSFSPDHFIDDADVGLDDLHDLVGDVFVDVVRDGDGTAIFLLADHLDGGVDSLEKSFCVDTGEDEAGLVQRLRTFGGGADADGGERVPDRGEERRFLGERAGVGDDACRVHLQTVVIVESMGFVLNHTFVELEPGGFEAFSASRVAGIEDRHVIFFRHLIDRGE